MAYRKNLRIYKPTGQYILKQKTQNGSMESLYNTYNEAYYELIEAQDKRPWAQPCIVPQMGRVNQNYDTRWPNSAITWTPATGVPITPPQSLDHYDRSAGWIYAAAEQDAPPLVKIGTTRALPQRMKSLAWMTYSPMLLLAAVFVDAQSYQVERTVHAVLASSRIEGEWFYLHMNQAKLEILVANIVSQESSSP